jgi:hypothetical protein
MMIFKKAIPRRTFLRGMGATIALPLLDGMIPAMAAVGDPAAQAPSRLSIVYAPTGIIMDKWTPAEEGAAFQLKPILEPLAPFRDRLLMLSGLNQNEARQRPGDPGGDHSRASAVFLTGVHPKYGAEVGVGTSLDQIAAKELGKTTSLASLELSLDPPALVGECDTGYTCAYKNTLSWRTPTTPMPMENQPRAVFERLFGDSDSTDRAERLARIRRDRSILDAVTRDVTRLTTGLGSNDRAKLTEWLDAIRDVERRIHVVEEQSSRELPTLERPVGIPDTFLEHAKLMFDMQVLAYQSDLTRVITFQMAQEGNNRSYPEIGIPDQHHPLTHHKYDPVKMEKVSKINTYHTQMFAYFLEKLQTTPDGDGSLLDHLTILYGSGMSDANVHSTQNLPILLVGNKDGGIKGGRHLRYPKDTPLTNLYLTMLDKLKVPVENLGDSTGKLELLSIA